MSAWVCGLRRRGDDGAADADACLASCGEPKAASRAALVAASCHACVICLTRHARERAERRAAEMLPNDVDRGRVLKACEHFDETHTRRLKAAETLRGMAELLTAERDAARLGGEGARSGQPAADEALITRIKPLLAAGEQLRKLGDLRTRDIEREGIPRQHLGIRLLERPAVASVFAPLDLDDEWDAAMRDRVELTHSEPRAVRR